MKKLQCFGGGTITCIWILMTILIPSLVAGEKSGCQLPSAWTGNWFENRFRTENLIKIDSTSVNFVHKDFLGNCVKEQGDHEHYIFELSEHKCTKCVFIHELHPNILRYRETDCLDNDASSVENSDVKHFCQDIHLAEIHDLIREDPFQPVPCPFSKEAFLFSYGKELNNNETICSSSNSHTESCFDNTKLVFKYDACRDMNNSARAEEIQCVGKWTDGSQNYLIATVLNHSVHSFVSGKYRCFLYNEIHDGKKVIGYNVSISATASCNGLTQHGMGEMALTLYLPGDENVGANKLACSWPSWFNYESRVWTALGNKFVINGTEKGSEILFNSNVNGGQTLGKLTCGQMLVTVKDEDITVLGREIVGCTGKDVCITLRKKTGSIAQLSLFHKLDQLTQAQFQSICFNIPSADTEMYTSRSLPLLLQEKDYTLVDEAKALANPTPCPFQGHFKLSQWAMNGSFLSRHRSMCHSPSPLQRQPEKLLVAGGKDETTIKFGNNEKHCGEGFEVAQCLGTWKEGENQDRNNFVVAFTNFSSSPHPLIYCFTYLHNVKDGKKVPFHARGSEHCPDPANLDAKAVSFFMQDLKFDDEEESTLKLSSKSSHLTSEKILFAVLTAIFIL